MDNKKISMVAIIALILAIAGYSIAESALSQEVAFEYQVNNTDLYAVGERTHGQNYTANNSAIQLFLTFHVVGTGAAISVDTNLSINGTVVADRDYRTSAGAGVHEHFSIIADIPKGAVYRVTNSSNLETIEWREYPILSGRNGTLSINQTTYNNYTNTTSAGDSYFRQFWQKQGTVVQGTWAWSALPSQTDYASVTAEGAGVYDNDATRNQNDEYKWRNIYLTAGSYNITLVWKSSAAGGIAEILHDNNSIGTIDMYRASPIYNQKIEFAFNISSTAKEDIRIRTTSKNASSTGYYIDFSRFSIEKTG